MKTIFGAIFFIIVFHYTSTGQVKTLPFERVRFEKAKINGEEASKFFRQVIRYPSGHADANVFVSFIIDKAGKIDSIRVLNEVNGIFKNEVLNALSKSSGLWMPTMFDGLALYKKYIAAFNFTGSNAFQYKKDKSLRYYRRGNMTKALKLLNEAIIIDPYDIELYKVRAEIYRLQSKPDLETLDLTKCFELNRDILFDIWFLNI